MSTTVQQKHTDGWAVEAAMHTGNSKQRGGVMDSTMLTPTQVSAWCGGRPSVRTLANWRSQGRRERGRVVDHGPEYVKVGPSVMYPLNAVAAYFGKTRRTNGTLVEDCPRLAAPVMVVAR